MLVKDLKQEPHTILFLERSLDTETMRVSLTYNLALRALHGNYCVTHVKKAFTIVFLSVMLGHLSIYSLYCDYSLLVVVSIVFVSCNTRFETELCEINILKNGSKSQILTGTNGLLTEKPL